jgi:2-C-methyl-D-erythritol 2,4-cyclodiphosphate synthase
MMREKKFQISNLDATVICERPKIGPVKDKIKYHLAQLLGCDASQINVKGKTHERVDAVGEGRAIEVHCVALLSSM